MTQGLDIGRAGRADIDMIAGWAAGEGWNPGRSDPGCFYAADPQGFWLARQDGEPAACLSLVTYTPDFAFLGFYIARPEYRGQGIGFALWQAALAACAATTIGLDGVVAQQGNYRKSGFTLAHRNVRYAGKVAVGEPDMSDIVPVDAARIDAVAIYDRRCFPAPRRAFLDAWLNAPGHVGRAATAGDRITGYGVIRPCREGHKIGPLFADDAPTAGRLFCALAATAPGATIILDAPEPNSAATELCRRHDMAPVFETARMYRGPAPALPLDRIFGITSFELG